LNSPIPHYALLVPYRALIQGAKAIQGQDPVLAPILPINAIGSRYHRINAKHGIAGQANKL
jgi:hypothetical protein